MEVENYLNWKEAHIGVYTHFPQNHDYGRKGIWFLNRKLPAFSEGKCKEQSAGGLRDSGTVDRNDSLRHGKIKLSSRYALKLYRLTMVDIFIRDGLGMLPVCVYECFLSWISPNNILLLIGFGDWWEVFVGSSGMFESTTQVSPWERQRPPSPQMPFPPQEIRPSKKDLFRKWGYNPLTNPLLTSWDI